MKFYLNHYLMQNLCMLDSLKQIYQDDGFLRIYDEIRYLASFHCGKYYSTYNRIITYNFSRYFAKLKVDSYDSLSVEKRQTVHNQITLLNQF